MAINALALGITSEQLETLDAVELANLILANAKANAAAVKRNADIDTAVKGFRSMAEAATLMADIIETQGVNANANDLRALWDVYIWGNLEYAKKTGKPTLRSSFNALYPAPKGDKE